MGKKKKKGGKPNTILSGIQAASFAPLLDDLNSKGGRAVTNAIRDGRWEEIPKVLSENVKATIKSMDILVDMAAPIIMKKIRNFTGSNKLSFKIGKRTKIAL